MQCNAVSLKVTAFSDNDKLPKLDNNNKLSELDDDKLSKFDNDKPPKLDNDKLPTAPLIALAVFFYYLRTLCSSWSECGSVSQHCLGNVYSHKAC